MITCLKYKIYFWIDYIRSEDNSIADALSRNKEIAGCIQLDNNNKIIDFVKKKNVSKSVNKIVKKLLKSEFCDL